MGISVFPKTDFRDKKKTYVYGNGERRDRKAWAPASGVANGFGANAKTPDVSVEGLL